MQVHASCQMPPGSGQVQRTVQYCRPMNVATTLSGSSNCIAIPRPSPTKIWQFARTTFLVPWCCVDYAYVGTFSASAAVQPASFLAAPAANDTVSTSAGAGAGTLSPLVPGWLRCLSRSASPESPSRHEAPEPDSDRKKARVIRF